MTVPADGIFDSNNNNGIGKASKDQTEPEINENGISVTVAALFVLGAVAGAGIMAMPHAFLKGGTKKFELSF